MTDSQANDGGFEGWVKWVFDHPVTEPEWYESENAEHWTASPVVIVDYITRLFEEAPTLLSAYSDAQAAQGLWFLGIGIFCDGVPSIYREAVLRSQRERCIRSIYNLFEKYFAIKCSSHLSNIDEQGANPLNVVCYMWWDFLSHEAQDPEGRIGTDMDADVLSTMQRILHLNQDACVESALHGLGHWQHLCPDDVAGIIDRFVATNPDVRHELRTYALEARSGRVQ
ncbi:MAG: hypothetical protein ABSA12_04660 [Verrucomicrobiia bacterium]